MDYIFLSKAQRKSMLSFVMKGEGPCCPFQVSTKRYSVTALPRDTEHAAVITSNIVSTFSLSTAALRNHKNKFSLGSSQNREVRPDQMGLFAVRKTKPKCQRQHEISVRWLGDSTARIFFLAESDEVGAALWSHVCIIVVVEDPPPHHCPLAG